MSRNLIPHPGIAFTKYHREFDWKQNPDARKVLRVLLSACTVQRVYMYNNLTHVTS